MVHARVTRTRRVARAHIRYATRLRRTRMMHARAAATRGRRATRRLSHPTTPPHTSIHTHRIFGADTATALSRAPLVFIHSFEIHLIHCFPLDHRELFQTAGTASRSNARKCEVPAKRASSSFLPSSSRVQYGDGDKYLRRSRVSRDRMLVTAIGAEARAAAVSLVKQRSGDQRNV